MSGYDFTLNFMSMMRRGMAFWWCLIVLALSPVAAMASMSLSQCHGMKDLVFVPHQDDDLLFMNPDVQTTINLHGCVQVVYLTAAERGEGTNYMLGRARGVRAAYAYTAKVANDWSEDIVMFGGRHQARFVLKGNSRVSLVHMRIKDPWLGHGWGSLTPLSQAESVVGATAQTLGPYEESYSRADLVNTIAAIIKDYRPTTIRHMDDTIAIPYVSLCWRCVGHDHPDHIASARLVRDAIDVAPGNYAEVGYIDYPTQERVSNLTAKEIEDKTGAFQRYAWDDYRYCAGPTHCKEPAGTAAAWVQRTYYVVRHNTAPALVADAQGGYMLLATGELNCAANLRRNTDKKWSSLGGRIAGALVAFNGPDGRTGVLARDASGRLWANIQNVDHQWRGWRDLKGMHTPAVPSTAKNANGRQAIVVMGNDGVFQYTEQARAPSDQFEPWSALPPLVNVLPQVAMALDVAGRLTIFAADREGQLWTLAQQHASGRSWSAWQRIRAISTSGGLAALRNATGHIELYVRDKSSARMLRLVQTAPGPARGRWSRAENLGFVYVGRPAIGMNEKGHVAVVAHESHGGPLWLVEEGSTTNLGGKVESAPALKTIRGTLYIAARSLNTEQTYQIWSRSDNAWQSPHSMLTALTTGGESFMDFSTVHKGTPTGDGFKTEAKSLAAVMQ